MQERTHYSSLTHYWSVQILFYLASCSKTTISYVCILIYYYVKCVRSNKIYNTIHTMAVCSITSNTQVTYIYPKKLDLQKRTDDFYCPNETNLYQNNKWQLQHKGGQNVFRGYNECYCSSKVLFTHHSCW